MADLEDDIEKYLKGQLGKAEMHALEKKALNDPFLADALEGADSVRPHDFLTDVQELKERISQRQKRKYPWNTVWRIAASIALLIGASYGIYTFVRPEEPITLAQKTSKPDTLTSPKNVTADSSTEPAKENPRDKLLSLNPAPTTHPGRAAKERRATKEESKPASEPVNPLTLTTVPAENQAASGAQAEKSVDRDLAKADDEIATQESREKLARTEQGPSEKKKDKVSHQDARAAQPVQAFRVNSPKQVKGKITDANDGSPIPGVNIQVEGTTQGAVTDANGNYQLITDSTDDNLIVSFIGYQTKEVKIPTGQSQLDVSLPTDVSALSEVVVSGYARREGESAQETPVQLAEPAGGKRAYKKYLEKNLHYPQIALEQKIEGRVTVEFTVHPDGTLSDFTVVRGLNPSCDEEVIRLVKAGPRWKPSSQGDVPVNSSVRVRVRFKLPK